MTSRPLIVDLEGVLLHTDLHQEAAVRLLRDNPAELLRSALSLRGGLVEFKRRLLIKFKINAATLPIIRRRMPAVRAVVCV